MFLVKEEIEIKDSVQIQSKSNIYFFKIQPGEPI